MTLRESLSSFLNTQLSEPDVAEIVAIVKRHGVQKKSIPAAYTHVFVRFYLIYPRKVGKMAAFKAWVKIPESDHELVIEKAKTYSKIVIDDHVQEAYIPHPATWLNGRRWEDENLNQRQLSPEEEIKRAEQEYLKSL